MGEKEREREGGLPQMATECVSLGWFPPSLSQILSHLISYHSTNPHFIFTFSLYAVFVFFRLICA